MPPEPTAAPAEPEADPTEDTQPDEDGDAGEDTQDASQPVDWEARYREAQKLIGRQGRELEILRRDGGADEGQDEDEQAEDTPQPDEGYQQVRQSSRLERDSWELARATYGDEAIDAYGRAYAVLERAVTPADTIAAFEAYHQARAGGATPEQATRKARVTPPAKPRVDPNRPDAAPDLTEIDKQIEAAAATGDSQGWFRAQLERLNRVNR